MILHAWSDLEIYRYTFNIICLLFQDIEGSSDTKNINIEKIATIFLYLIVFKEKNKKINMIFNNLERQ